MDFYMFISKSTWFCVWFMIELKTKIRSVKILVVCKTTITNWQQFVFQMIWCLWCVCVCVCVCVFLSAHSKTLQHWSPQKRVRGVCVCVWNTHCWWATKGYTPAGPIRARPIHFQVLVVWRHFSLQVLPMAGVFPTPKCPRKIGLSLHNVTRSHKLENGSSGVRHVVRGNLCSQQEIWNK